MTDTVHRPIRAVLFDLDGTLRISRPAATLTMLDFAAELGIHSSNEQRLAAQRWVHSYWAQSSDFQGDYEIFGSLSPDFWMHYCSRLLHALGCPPEQAAAVAPRLHERMELEYHPIDWVDPHTIAMLEQLRADGVALAVVSNREQTYHEHIQALGMTEYFAFALAAGEVQSWKPNIEIFEHALARLGIPANQAAYVGDNYYADILGARRAGLLPVLYDPEQVFPDADCAVIYSMADLPATLRQGQPQAGGQPSAA